MKSIAHRLSNIPNKDKALSWFKLISITGGAQLIGQLIGLVSGIIIIRLLPTKEYGFYTLANTMLGTMTILADGGIASGVMAHAGKVWKDKVKSGIVLATGLDMRRKFAIGSLIVSIPFLIYLLIHQDAGWLTTLLIVASLIPAFYAALSDSLLEIVPKLHQTILPLQKNQLVVGAARLVLSTLTLFVFPWAFVAIIASGLPRIYGNLKLRKIGYNFADRHQQPDPLIQKEILKMVKRILPGAIYFCLSGQITIWLISIFGNTTSVAQLGALGRLGMLLSLFSVLTSTLIIPRFARLPEKRIILLKYFVRIMLMLIFFLLLVIVVVYAFPNQILWILGKGYAGLEMELLLSIIGSCLSVLGGVAFSLYTSRGWVIHPVLLIIGNLVSIIIGMFLFDISSLKGVLLFNLFTSVFAIVLNSGFLYWKILKSL